MKMLTTAEAIEAYWRSRTAEDGTVEYFDPAAHVWRSLAESVKASEARKQRRGAIGDERDWATQNTHERARGL